MDFFKFLWSASKHFLRAIVLYILRCFVENPVISCVICVYNTEKYIEECFDYILCQKDIPFECVIVDNASTDGTPLHYTF